ncbi:MAG: hypothetical protein ABR587_12005 [Candidatus Binatia bacterium]
MSTAAAFEMHGVRVRLESELPAFLDYAKAALEPWLTAESGRFDIRSRLQWRDGLPPRRVGKDGKETGEGGFEQLLWTRRPDRDLYLSEKGAQWLRIDDFPDLQMQLAMREESVELTGRYFFHLAGGGSAESLQRLRHRSQLETLRGRRFSTLLYYLFYHPLLWWLSRGAGWQVLHGAGIATPIGAIVLAGMPGCGKSTLSVAMLADPRHRMLSDNLVLHDGANVMACPELLLLDENSRRLAGAGADKLVATGEKRVFARDAYRIADVELSPQPVAALLHVERASEFALRPLDPPESTARLRAANMMAKEVRRVLIMNEVLDVVSGARRYDEATAAQRLAEAVPSFELRVPPVSDLVAFARDRVLAELYAGLGADVA